MFDLNHVRKLFVFFQFCRFLDWLFRLQVLGFATCVVWRHPGRLTIGLGNV